MCLYQWEFLLRHMMLAWLFRKQWSEAAQIIVLVLQKQACLWDFKLLSVRVSLYLSLHF